jgi:hypothetical protein
MEKERRKVLRAEYNELRKQLMAERNAADDIGDEEVDKIALKIMHQRQLEKEGPKVQ